jgi:hypothetical protein
MSVHHKIAALIIELAEKQQHPLRTLITGETPSDACHQIFSSYRGGATSGKGLRLSDVGLQLMKTFFKCYEIPLPGGYKITAPHLIYLDRIAEMPYWLNHQYISVFDSDLAMMLRLMDGNLQSLVDSRYRLDTSDDSAITR